MLFQVQEYMNPGTHLTLQNQDVRYVTQAMAFAHCAINPILYVFILKRFFNQLLTSLFKKGLLGRDTMSNIEWDLSRGNPSPQAGALVPRGPHQWDFRSCSPNPPPISGLCIDSHSVRVMALQLNLNPPRPGLCLDPLTLRLHHHLLFVQLF